MSWFSTGMDTKKEEMSIQDEGSSLEKEEEMELENLADVGNQDIDYDQVSLDCYPYTFTPLLLFSKEGYFDKGYSNYNAVAQFFQSVIPVNMLENVLYDKKNMLYEELLDYVTRKEIIVVCCINAHFTAFQVIKEGRKPALLHYDPLRSNLQRVSGDGFRTLALFLLMKCNYGDSQHIQENKDHYTGIGSNTTRRTIYQLWRKINTIDSASDLYGISYKNAPLNIDRYLLINDPLNYRCISKQLTSNTCYFQTFLFAVLCKICAPVLNNDGVSIDLENLDALEVTTVYMCQFMLRFFVYDEGEEVFMRPLTNSNFVIDFYRFGASPYYKTVLNYLRTLKQDVPAYELQYNRVMEYFWETKCLHKYDKFLLDSAMSSSSNTKSLQRVFGSDDAVLKLARADYYKYRAANLMFGFNASIMHGLESFSEFNAFRKNQLLMFYEETKSAMHYCADAISKAKTNNKYLDYYFMPQFEVGQQELVDIHYYTYLVDLFAMTDINPDLKNYVYFVNEFLVDHIFFSTQKQTNYEKFVSIEEFKKSKRYFRFFLNKFMTVEFLTEFIGFGFADINPKEKEINSLTQTVFYSHDLMRIQANRQSFEFEKECINQMARSNLRRYSRRFEGDQSITGKYQVNIKIGFGYTYNKYNTLFHFLNVVKAYWNNPDISNVQVFGKDIRVLLAISCQKIFFQKDHPGYYYYGPFENGYTLDLAVASSVGNAIPSVTKAKHNSRSQLMITDRVFEYDYLKRILHELFTSVHGVRIKSDNEVINLSLLSLMLDFGLYKEYGSLLNLPFLNFLKHETDTRELQVEVANRIYEFDKKNDSDFVTRNRVEDLLFETSYKFIVNKHFPVQSRQFRLIQTLNSDPDFQSYVLMVKIYMSLCQINKSSEVDYYKVRCDGEFRIVIPHNFSKATSNYLDEVTQSYSFSEKDDFIIYDDLPIFDLRPQQPEINLHKVRFDSPGSVQSMVKYIEISNVFKVIDEVEKYLIFIADNVLLVDNSGENGMAIRINKMGVGVATVFFNEAISFIPCFKYAESEDVILFTSRNINYSVSQAGQFCTDYYGMKHSLMECINSEEVFVDLNDEHIFQTFKLSELLTESKTVIYFPDYLLQVPDRKHLINLLDLAVHIRNISFFILVLFYLRRGSVALEFIEREGSVRKIAGPWKEAILYVLDRAESNPHYEAIFERQFFNLNQYKDEPLEKFIDLLCQNFTKYQRFIDGEYQIKPTLKQKAFLKKIICAENPLMFSEVGSGKTKVILPLLCQTFLSNNVEAHKNFARGGKLKSTLVILVPEHLVSDARTQVYRYCLNLNFRQEYRVYDDIFALMHRNVRIDGSMKQIFVTSFNTFKKALTYDVICAKVWPYREKVLVVADEVDDFLDRNKLVFNICSNKSNSFVRPMLDCFYEVSRAAYNEMPFPNVSLSSNVEYWKQLHKKFIAIQTEIQDASRSINRSFGIFNEYTLRHCSTNVVRDIEGYKGLIARPYESVNRAMPGSYYSDVERTIYLTYVILTEDIPKYDELFQAERKFISFEYWNTYFVHQLDFDDLVYGHEKLSEIVDKHPKTRDGLARYLYEIILRRMEIRDKSRSVNSIDVIFNFDCIGFTGTPFLDNYPTFDYIRNGRKDKIPDLIDRSFYAYTSDRLSVSDFEKRFIQFQGQNNNVLVQYVSSDFISKSSNEMETLQSIFSNEELRKKGTDKSSFNTLVDLCGIFKQSTIHDVRDLIKKHFGSERFKFVYHIDPADNRDRVLCINSENDAQYDEEFYNYMCNTYGASMRDKIFFFVDNRNVIGKDIPFQLVYQRHYGQPLFRKSVVLAHDVDDFSRIWQAMGRSRTMNETEFSIYKSGVGGKIDEGRGVQDIKKHELTRTLYVHNCDCKMAGNISSIYLTLVALHNLSHKSFYYCDDIVNAFLEKMEKTISKKIEWLESQLSRHVLKNAVPAQIFFHILTDKFKRSPNKSVSGQDLTVDNIVEKILHAIVNQKYEQRVPSGDIFDEFIMFLSGEQGSLMEISYTKQQQKQKQKQSNKNQNSDAMGLFNRKNQLQLMFETDNYFENAKIAEDDLSKVLLNLPCSNPITTITYNFGQGQQTINLYPTLQFLYSHHIQGSFMTPEVQSLFKNAATDVSKFYQHFLAKSKQDQKSNALAMMADDEYEIKTKHNFILPNPLYTIVGLEKGVYIIGMKEQFNVHDIQNQPLKDSVRYIADEMGFVLFDETEKRSVDSFGPYFIEQYIIMEVLSKQEVAENVIDYYHKNKDILNRALQKYDEKQGTGFVCWRFLMNETAKTNGDEQSDHWA